MYYRFDAETPLRWVDVDSVGVVNNAVYMSLMEQARYAYFTHLDLMRDHQIPFVLAEAKLQFVRPGRLGMKVRVGARTTKLGTTSFQMDYEIRGGEEVLCTASATLVFVDEQMRPTPLPATFREAVAQFEELRDEST